MNLKLISSMLLLLLVCGCGAGSGPSDTTLPTAQALEPGGPIPYPQVEDNVRNDTLLIQVTFGLGKGDYLMVASHIEENFDGLRLYLYRLGPDSSAIIKASSSPAYDSWTMLPTLFNDSRDSTAHIVLANLGERDSWGQKVLGLSDRFEDMGFLDVALPEHVQEQDTAFLKLRSIAPYTRCMPENGGLRFAFVCDSVQLFDDLRGNHDLMLPASSIWYTWESGTGMMLWLNGEARRPAPNAI